MKDECLRLAEKISALLDGDLGGPELAELLRHLDECGCCRHCLETLRQTRALLERLPAPEMPPELKARLKACLKND
jgi:anti-sigma factor RsiW